MISSRQNSLIKLVRKLRQRKARQAEGLFWVEGIRGFLSAVEAKATIHAAIYAPDLLKSERCYTILSQLQSAGVRVEAVTSRLFGAIAVQENPTGIGAVIHADHPPLSALQVTTDSLFVALVDVADPGNAGTILRTLDAVSGAGLILCGNSTDVTHPTAVKASMGGIFSVPIVYEEDVGEVLAWAKENQVAIVATSAKAKQSYWDVAYRMPALLLMGSERHGLSADYLTSADHAVGIPMNGGGSSLNLGVATSLLLYEICRQKSA